MRILRHLLHHFMYMYSHCHSPFSPVKGYSSDSRKLINKNLRAEIALYSSNNIHEKISQF